jgi:hypothetical protein
MVSLETKQANKNKLRIILYTVSNFPVFTEVFGKINSFLGLCTGRLCLAANYERLLLFLTYPV